MKEKHLARILLVDNDDPHCCRHHKLLENHFSEVKVVLRPEDAIAELQSNHFDAVVCSLQLTNGSYGLEVRRWIVENNYDTFFVLLTAYGEDPHLQEALIYDEFLVLQRPAHPEELILPLKALAPRNIKKAA